MKNLSEERRVKSEEFNCKSYCLNSFNFLTSKLLI